MHNPNSGLIALHTGQTRTIRVKAAVKGFLQGGRFVTPADPPFEVEAYRAAELVRLQMAEYCVQLAVAGDDIMSALHPGPARAERATAPAARPARGGR